MSLREKKSPTRPKLWAKTQQLLGYAVPLFINQEILVAVNPDIL